MTLESLQEKLRFLFNQGANEITIGLAIDAVLTWVRLGSIGGQIQGQIQGQSGVKSIIGQYSDPVSGLLSASSPEPLIAKSPRRYNLMSLPPGFGEFWGLFWRKVKKAKAISAWVKIAPDPELTQVILAAVRAQQREQLERESKFRPHAATWLNGREWENEPEPAPTGNGKPVHRSLPSLDHIARERMK